jgi:VCBS repeat-containing protein
MFGFRGKKKGAARNEKKEAEHKPPASGAKRSFLSLEQRLMFDAAAAATASEVATEQVAQEQAEAAVSSDAGGGGPTEEQAESQGVLDAIAAYSPGDSRTEVVFVDPTVPNYQDLLSGMNSNIEVIMLDSGQDGIEQMANALSGRTGIDAIHVISHGGAGELQLGTGVLNADSMSTQYVDDLAVIRQSLSEQADILVYGCEFAQGETGQAAVDMLADFTGADVQASNDLTGSISLGGDWEFEVSTGTIETTLAVDYNAQMNWAGMLGTETVSDTFSDKSFGNNDGTSSWASNWSEVDRGASDADGGHIKVNSGELRIEAKVVGASVSRGVDLSRVSSATLSFNYTNDLDKGGSVDIRISTDGGKSYKNLDSGTFSSAENTGSGTAKFDISGYASADTKIQFVVTGTGGGDRLYIDNVQVSYETGPTNNAPTDLSLSANTVAENATTGTVVGTITGTDPDAGDTKSYSLTDTAGGRFAINSSTGEITVADGSLLNYEAAASHNLTVQVTDSGGQSYTESFTINLTNVNEGPIITSNGGGAAAAVNVAENQNAVTIVTAMDIDAGTTLAYGIVGGPDSARFSIDSATGALRFSTAPNFERPSDVGRNNVYDVTVQVSDGQGGTATQSISVRVTDVNEAPRITSNRGGDVASVTIRENSSAVTTVRATDPDRGARITYSIVGGTDAALFTINSNSGVLGFSSTPNFEQPTDADRNNVYQVVVQASDGRGGTDSQVINIQVANVNEEPTGADATVTISEDTPRTLTAADFGFSDVDAGNTMSAVRIDTLPTAGTLTLAGVAVTAGQVISAANITVGNLVFTPAADANGTGYASVSFSVRDSANAYDTAPNTLTFNVTAINDAPTDLSLSANTVAENATTGSVVGTITGTDPDVGDTKSYSLTDTAGGRFAINSSTGELTVADGSLLNYESATSHTVTVRVTDSGGQSYDETFTINLTNVNETPIELKGGKGEEVGFLYSNTPATGEVNTVPLSSLSIADEVPQGAIRVLDDARKPVEWSSPPASTIDTPISGRNHPEIIHEMEMNKKGTSESAEGHSNVFKQGDETAGNRDSQDGQETVELEQDQVPLASDERQDGQDDSGGLTMPITMGLMGAVLHGSFGAKGKMTSMQTPMHPHDQKSPAEKKPQESRTDDKEAPPSQS